LDSVPEVTSLLEQVGVIDAKLDIHDNISDEGLASQHSVDYVESFNKLGLDSDDMLIQNVDKLTEKLFLVPHFDILINLLQYGNKVGLIDSAADIV
jgi:hypothetical protein